MRPAFSAQPQFGACGTCPAEARAAPRALPTPAQWLEMQGFINVNWAAIHAWLGAQSALLVRRVVRVSCF
jgi:hypothetical protein